MRRIKSVSTYARVYVLTRGGCVGCVRCIKSIIIFSHVSLA